MQDLAELKEISYDKVRTAIQRGETPEEAVKAKRKDTANRGNSAWAELGGQR